jgi:hypothetical protein
MKALRIITAAALLTATAQVPAQARPFTTSKDFLEFCAIDEAYNQATCSAYVWGLAEGLRTLSVQYKPDFWCMPPNTNMKDLYDIGRSFMLANPELTHYKPSDLLTKAWQQAYPCKTGDGN